MLNLQLQVFLDFSLLSYFSYNNSETRDKHLHGKARDWQKDAVFWTVDYDRQIKIVMLILLHLAVAFVAAFRFFFSPPPGLILHRIMNV